MSNENKEMMNVDPAVVQNIATQIFQALPMLRKRIQKFDMNSDHAMPLSHVQVLAVLEEEGSMTVSEISRRFNIAKPNITPLVDRLSADGLVERQRSTLDRRVVNIAILDAGRERLRQTQETIYRMINGWSDRITPEDFKELSDALDSLIRILSNV